MPNTVYIAPELRDRFREDKLFDQLKAVPGEVYRDMGTRRTIRFHDQGHAYFAKLHFGVGWLEIFKNLFQGRLPVVSAANEWRAVKRLTAAGVDTLEPVLYCKSGWNPARMRSCIITRALDATISLEDLIADSNKTSLLLKRKLLARVAAIARTMHAQGINHRDFYLCHFLLEESGQKLFLIDLHRAQIRCRTPVRWRAKDIGALFFSALEAGLTQGDLLRFIRCYLPDGRRLRESLTEDKRFWDRVRRRAIRLYLQDHDALTPDIARLTGYNPARVKTGSCRRVRRN